MAVQLLLEVRENGAAVIKQVSGDLTQLEQKTMAAGKSAITAESSFSILKQGWFQATAVAGVLALGIDKVFEAAMRGAQAEQATGRLNLQLAEYGRTAASLVPEIKALASGQLTLADATKLASQGLAQGLNPDQLKTFTQLATVAADVMGTSIPQALDQLLSSIASGRTGLLKQIGIVVDLGEAKLKLAKDTGVAVEAITSLQEQQLLLNEIMKKAPDAIKRVSDSTESNASGLQRQKAKFLDFVDPSGGGVIGLFTKGVIRLSDSLEQSGDKAKAWARALSPAAEVARMEAEEVAILTERMREEAAADYAAQLALDLLASSHAAAALKIQQTADAEYRERLATDLGTAAITAKTAALAKLTDAQSILAGLDAEQAQADLTRGGPEDAMRRIRQAAFEGGAGTSTQGLQGLIGTTKGITGGDEEDKARLLRDLMDALRLRATGNANEAQRITGTPQQQAELERSGGESVGPYGLRQPTIIQPTLPEGGSTITIPVYIGGEHLTTVTRKIDEQRRSDDALVGE